MLMNNSLRYCPYCGKAAALNWKYCAACGKGLPEQVSTEIADVPDPKIAAVQKESQWDKAIISVRLGELDIARQVLTSLLADSPQNFQALALLGSVCLRQRRIEEAKHHLDLALKQAPESAFVRMKMAEYWMALGIPSRALEELARAEEFAAADIPLLIEIRTFSKGLQDKMRGNLIREPPALPAGSVTEILRRIRRSA